MLTKKLLPLLLTVLAPLFIKAEWIPLDGKSSNPAPPNVTLISSDNTSSVFRIDISGFDLKNITADGKEYHLVDLMAESFVTVPGMPSLPYIAKTFAIPDQAGITVEILESDNIMTFQNIHLAPARESWQEGEPETSYFENEATYRSNEVFPEHITQTDPPAIFRDLRIARVSAYPVRYNPAKKELQVTSSLTVKINYVAGEVINPKTSPKRKIAPSYGQLYRSSIFNYQNVLDGEYGGREDGHELMLCIMPDDFYNSFQNYAEWKRQSGIDIAITKFSDIGANSSDPDIIRDHIADAYFNWEVPPTYVLLIGDEEIIPVYYSSGYVSENHYAEIEGGDFFPDVLLGRFTNQSDYVMQVMTNKFIKYEKTPYIENTEWFKKGVCCSNDAYASQVETKRYAAERMTLDGGFIVDTMMSDPGCTYSVSDVLDVINEGRSHLNYRGEGWTTGWWASCTPLNNSHIQNLGNSQKLTFVTSIGCGVAMFASGESFGEVWIEQGSISAPRGAVAFLGPAGNTHTTYNNKIDKGIYKGMFTENLNTAGQGLERGRLYLYNVYGTDPQVGYHYKIYCVLGDPSIHIWKEIPKEVTVDYPESITFGTSLVDFTVKHTASGLPVENAIVCVSGDDTFVTGNTDATGVALLEISTEELATFTVTVTGPDVYPYQGTMEALPPTGPWVVYDYFELNDFAGGNGNHEMDYGESILLSLAVKNIGPTSASNINVVLTSSDPYITFNDNVHNYTSVPSGESVMGTDAFSFTVADDLPDGHEVTIFVTANWLFSSWDSYFTIVGNAPLLSTGYITVLDANGNNNGLLDPGETADITFSVSNDGNSNSPDAIAYLSTTYEFITFNNSSDDVGPVNSGESLDAIFNVTVSPDAVLGDMVDLDAEVIAGSYEVSNSYSASIGYMIEDWETGNFNKFPWAMGGDADWVIVTDNPYEGIYSARSGNINDSQNSALEITIGVTGDGQISFFKKVSSEQNWDYFRFYIDGSLMDEWSGEVDWSEESYPVTAGVHTFTWEYVKDYIYSNGEDCAWLDYIIFPSPEPPIIPPYETAFDESGSIPDGWYNVMDDDIDWTIHSGETPSPHTGPQGDHTTGSGYYFYIEATYNNPDFRADLITPTFNLANITDSELTFWYHMWDDDYVHMGDLHLDASINDGEWIEDIMTPIVGNQGNEWFERVVDISAFDGEVVKFRFRGITGPDWASDICIDDFSVEGSLTPTGFNLDLTAFLEGPCTGTEMSTYLCACNSVPLAQPFFAPPWNYEGNESMLVMPGNAVDWVLVELRDAPSAVEAVPATMVTRQAALLLKDGSIVATDGSSPLFFENTIVNNLYTVVYHRNHLAIMSANALTPEENMYIYDFTTASEQAFGNSAQKQLSDNLWGMMSGDCDANGIVEDEDILPGWETDAGKAGYLPADMNLDQQVDNMDKNVYWQPNNGKESKVPQ